MQPEQQMRNTIDKRFQQTGWVTQDRSSLILGAGRAIADGVNVDHRERQGRRPFAPEQREWLAMIHNHVAASLTVDAGAYASVPFNQRGGLGRAYQLFGEELPDLLWQINEQVAA